MTLLIVPARPKPARNCYAGCESILILPGKIACPFLPVSSGIGVLSVDNDPRCLVVSPDRSKGHYRRQELVVGLNADPRRVRLVVTLEK